MRGNALSYTHEWGTPKSWNVFFLCILEKAIAEAKYKLLYMESSRRQKQKHVHIFRRTYILVKQKCSKQFVAAPEQQQKKAFYNIIFLLIRGRSFSHFLLTLPAASAYMLPLVDATIWYQSRPAHRQRMYISTTPK